MKKPPNNNFKFPLKYGEIRYVSGSKTKVKIIGELKSPYPLCRVLALGERSVFKVGEVKKIYRRILYPRNEYN